MHVASFFTSPTARSAGALEVARTARNSVAAGVTTHEAPPPKWDVTTRATLLPLSPREGYSFQLSCSTHNLLK
jgi:hypothetical protein